MPAFLALQPQVVRRRAEPEPAEPSTVQLAWSKVARPARKLSLRLAGQRAPAQQQPAPPEMRDALISVLYPPTAHAHTASADLRHRGELSRASADLRARRQRTLSRPSTASNAPAHHHQNQPARPERLPRRRSASLPPGQTGDWDALLQSAQAQGRPAAGPEQNESARRRGGERADRVLLADIPVVSDAHAQRRRRREERGHGHRATNRDPRAAGPGDAPPAYARTDKPPAYERCCEVVTPWMARGESVLSLPFAGGVSEVGRRRVAV